MFLHFTIIIIRNFLPPLFVVHARRLIILILLSIGTRPWKYFSYFLDGPLGSLSFSVFPLFWLPTLASLPLTAIALLIWLTDCPLFYYLSAFRVTWKLLLDNMYVVFWRWLTIIKTDNDDEISSERSTISKQKWRMANTEFRMVKY